MIGVFFKVFFKIVRAILGPILLTFERLTPPKAPEYSRDVQKRLDELSSRWVIYEFNTCPFCIRVRKATKRLGLKVERKDVRKDPEAERELMLGGGERQVPCLKISESNGSIRWMYESSDIIRFLEEQVSKIAHVS